MDHDVLEYGVQGRWFLDTLEATYQRLRFDAVSGFYYVGLHGFSFPLLFTWEGLWERLTGATATLGAQHHPVVHLAVDRLGVGPCCASGTDRWLPWGCGTSRGALRVRFLLLVSITLDSLRIILFTCAMAAWC
ncbi:MAG: hypothetical protein IPM68_09940 [Flavobacteriales bacterium]|nr:hypothetical protein [Flavobacteriales bacterium]